MVVQTLNKQLYKLQIRMIKKMQKEKQDYLHQVLDSKRF